MKVPLNEAAGVEGRLALKDKDEDTIEEWG